MTIRTSVGNISEPLLLLVLLSCFSLSLVLYIAGLNIKPTVVYVGSVDWHKYVFSANESAAPTEPPIVYWRNTSMPLYGPQEGKWFDGYEKRCLKKTVIAPLQPDNSTLPLCPCVPSTPLGHVAVTFESPPWEEIRWRNPNVQPGGQWGPTHCYPRTRVAIIFPYRHRAGHLRMIINHLLPILQRQQVYFRIFVSEMAGNGTFNKATMMNIGFLEAMKRTEFDCIVFHDVDLFPEDGRSFFTCYDHVPRHVAAYLDRWKYRIIYGILFGGSTAFTPEQFRRVNGFSNEFYGWGGEDDDLSMRLRRTYRYSIRWPPWLARYKGVPHARDKGNPRNPSRAVAVRYRPALYPVQGVNSVVYELLYAEDRTLYTWLLSRIPPSKDKILILNTTTSIATSPATTKLPSTTLEPNLQMPTGQTAKKPK